MTLKDKYNVEFGTQNTSLVKRWNRAIKKEISKLTIEELSMFVRQKAFYDTVVPLLLRAIEANPFYDEIDSGEPIRALLWNVDSLREYRDDILATLDRIEPVVASAVHEDQPEMLEGIKKLRLAFDE